jgi:hypothetical protein
MKSAALARLESLLQARKLDVTLTSPLAAPPPPDRLVPSGVAAVDRVLAGGWRRGEISEILGPRSSGRTTVLVSTLAAATAQGEVVALVDTLDRFDPVTAAAAGLDLDRMLWVRGPAMQTEARRHATVSPALANAVRQAVRAIDLIVRAGGFAVAALDLADVPARALSDLPWTTWLRLAHANEGSRTACVLVGESPRGRSARGVSVRVDAAPRWTGESPQSRRLERLEIRAS